VRRVLAAFVGVLLVVVAGVVVHRVFAPGEVLARPTAAYPPAPAVAAPGVVGTLPSAPLIVDGRLRVVADKRQVSADGPVDSRYLNTPYWSLRRWPAQVLGVVAAGSTVVTRWSDGVLVALDARSGQESWRAQGDGPVSPDHPAVRTGAAAVYAPEGLYVADDLVVAVGAVETRAFHLATGAERWRAGTVCRAGGTAGFTTSDGRIAAGGGCALLDARTGAASGSLPEGDAVPVGCATPRSACAGVLISREGEVEGLLFGSPGSPATTPAPALAGPDARLVDGAAVTVAGGDVVAVGAADGGPRWRHPVGSGATVLAVQPGLVHVLTAERDLVTLDAGTGAERSRFRYTYFAEGTDWVPGYAYAADGFVATERLRGPADDYFDAQPVILAAT